MFDTNRCPICGEKAKRPILAALEHFKLWRPKQAKIAKGNIRTFGLWRGLFATLEICCPAYNTIRYWAVRGCRLRVYLDSGAEHDAAQQKGGAV